MHCKKKNTSIFSHLHGPALDVPAVESFDGLVGRLLGVHVHKPERKLRQVRNGRIEKSRCKLKKNWT